MKITVYEPVLGPKEGNGDWYTVNGAISENRDAAISAASKHSGIKSGKDEIKRVDEIEVEADAWFK